jgi:hypothetical protein
MTKENTGNSPQIDRPLEGAPDPVARADLLDAFMEEYEWVRDCIKEMEKNPKMYNAEDHSALPRYMEILKIIAKNAGLSLT